jgi:glutamate dehydrogenase
MDGMVDFVARRDDVMAQICELVRASDPAGADAFVRSYYEHLGDDDLATWSTDELAAAALEHWRLGAQRKAGEVLVRVYTPAHGHTAIDVILDDMPFLVDSLTMALDRRNLGVHLVVHPILCVVRTAAGELLGLADPSDTSDTSEDATPRSDREAQFESWTHIEVDRETSTEILDAVRGDLLAVLHDVRAATSDWRPMLDALERVAVELQHVAPPCPPDELIEGKALLHWLADDNFAFLGYRAYDLTDDDRLLPVPGSGLGLLREAPERPSQSFAKLPKAIRAKAHEKTLLVLTKANARSTVHRPTHLDYIGIKRYDASGKVVGEHRFIGLYASGAYMDSPFAVPVLRRKVEAVIERAGFLPASHDHKDLVQILETYPRDDLFQTDVDHLLATAMGILRLQERRRVRLFVHLEPFGRFVSCLVFIPRDRYTTQVRERIAGRLIEAYGANEYEWNTRLSDSVLARLHYVLHLEHSDVPTVDEAALEKTVASATRAWVDDLRDALMGTRGEETGLDQFRIWSDAFPPAYQDDFDAGEALVDLPQLERIGATEPLAARLTIGADHLDLKLYGIGAQPSLSEVLPRLTNLGVIVDDEHPYEISPRGIETRWMKWFRLHAPTGTVIDPAALRLFEEAFLAVVDGRAEDDAFNGLVLTAGLAWREVALLRAFGRYLRQVGTRFSQTYIANALGGHTDVARRLVELFVARLDPWVTGVNAATADAERARGDGEATSRLADEIRTDLDAVTSLDEDRILRALLHLVLATLRTNWFQDADAAGNPPACLALKLDPSAVPDLPLPKPMFEIFVYSPRVEGVHLRAGRVARGGIRWSDRREDFRTEVLGLMKAQRVKNAVIVPAGAKGGFVVKRPPADAAQLRDEVEACYRLFIGALLDVTDNLVAGKVVPPDQVLRYDGDDPYLVVAADKGTAAFSDIANEIALARGFWLGDAFASGGEHGYDHKEMGITARGAWESVRRHFRHLDLDPDRDDFTVAGIGDMSGDVFGNAMLLSEHIALVAAFDHRHVFLDPTPDPAKSFLERRRLFDLPRSSWDDYDSALVSPGGGVYARTLKAIPISPEVRARLVLDESVESLTPAELIRAILRAPVDLLYNGGIGTYVKARAETNAAVGDKANDVVRIDGHELRCRCVAEGGNLGFTQDGRVEYALGGGRINTDAIDNSAGVDTSDHEVNIKIVLDGAVRDGQLTEVDRNTLLVSMTDEVAALVLRDNYRQNRALDNGRSQASEMEGVHVRFIHALEARAHLDRDVERLPSDDQLNERHNAGIGLTSPELAVLLAYAKISLEEELLASDLPDDDDFVPELVRAFPSAVRGPFLERIRAHTLRREITATALVNGVVNRAGTTFAFRLGEETGAAAPDIVRAHETARAVFDQDALWRDIEALDPVIGVDVQTHLYLASRRLVERGARWLLRSRPQPLPVATTVAFFAVPVARLTAMATVSPRIEAAAAEYAAKGVPAEMAARIAALERLPRALDIAELADAHGVDVEVVAATYDEVGEQLRFELLADRIVELPRADRWDALARNALREDAASQYRRVVDAVLTAGSYEEWAGTRTIVITRMLAFFEEIRAHAVYDVATLSVALRELRSLT